MSSNKTDTKQKPSQLINESKLNNESKDGSNLKKDEIISAKHVILDKIIRNHSFLSKYTTEEFKKAWRKLKISSRDLDSIVAVYFIIAFQVRYCYLISSNKYTGKPRPIGRKVYIVGADSAVIKQLCDVENGTYKDSKGRGKPFDVVDHVLLRELTEEEEKNSNLLSIFQNSQNRKINEQSNTQIKSTTVFVYFRLTNSCMRNNHQIESVTAKTNNAKNGTPISVNVFHCKNCDKYFINYEALQKYISKGIYPALKYSLVNDISGSLNDASELMLYGYNVREGCLSQLERRRILEWIIDAGLLSKADIIRDLQFKVRYNGSKLGNERARQKWLDDIQFVSQYTRDNRKVINATFIYKDS